MNRYGPGPASEPPRPARRGGPRGRPGPYRLRWTSLYRSGRDRLRTAGAASRRGRRVLRRSSQGLPPGRRETARGISRKSRDVYAVITDFSLQLQGRRRTGTESGWPWTASAPVPVGEARRGAGHTSWRDMPTAWAIRTLLAPVPAGWAAAARERPRPGRVPRCLPTAAAPSASLRSATRAPGRCVTQRWHAPAPGALAL